jgi:hypothetical protein
MKRCQSTGKPLPLAMPTAKPTCPGRTAACPAGQLCNPSPIEQPRIEWEGCAPSAIATVRAAAAATTAAVTAVKAAACSREEWHTGLAFWALPPKKAHSGRCAGQALHLVQRLKTALLCALPLAPPYNRHIARVTGEAMGQARSSGSLSEALAPLKVPCNPKPATPTTSTQYTGLLDSAQQVRKAMNLSDVTHRRRRCAGQHPAGRQAGSRERAPALKPSSDREGHRGLPKYLKGRDGANALLMVPLPRHDATVHDMAHLTGEGEGDWRSPRLSGEEARTRHAAGHVGRLPSWT